MSRSGNEDELIAEAGGMLAELPGVADTEVLAAGVFSLAELLAAQTAGVVAGTASADLVGGRGGAQAIVGAAGGRLAVEAAAAAKGASVRLVVGVTTSAIHVLNTDRRDLAPELARFDRTTARVTITKMGLSRIVEILDPPTGAKVALHGSVSPLSAQSKPDRIVMALLAP